MFSDVAANEISRKAVYDAIDTLKSANPQA